MSRQWWENPHYERYEKWTAFFLIPVLLVLVCFGIWLIVDTRHDIIERDERRIERAERRNTALIEDLEEIRDELQRDPGTPERSEVFSSVKEIEEMIEELLERHQPDGSQSPDP